MSDIGATGGALQAALVSKPHDARPVGAGFRVVKRTFDVTVSLVLLPLLAAVALALLIANPVLNRGPLFFVQRRMGRHCRAFAAFKFRTMRSDRAARRLADGPLETDRITWLGGLLRRSRVDELPQIVNVLRGEMSLIGPRPDYYEHARHFLTEVPGYRERHCVRPGISGLAQTEIGYVEGTDATHRKVSADLFYISNCSLTLETWIIWRTVVVILGRGGA